MPTRISTNSKIMSTTVLNYFHERASLFMNLYPYTFKVGNVPFSKCQTKISPIQIIGLEETTTQGSPNSSTREAKVKKIPYHVINVCQNGRLSLSFFKQVGQIDDPVQVFKPNQDIY